MPAETTLEQVYDQHAEAVFRLLLNITRSEADTLDLMQELFRRLAAEPALVRKACDLRAFLLRTAHNLAIDAIRRRSARDKSINRLAAEAPVLFDGSPQADEALFRQALDQALAELPIDQRTVVHLKLWEGLTFERIAETLEISLNTAASRYRYGLDKLRARLRPLYDEIK